MPDVSDFPATVVGTPAAPPEVLPYEPWLPPEQAAANSTPIIKTHRDRPSERRRTVDIGVNARCRAGGFRSRTAGAGRRLVTGATGRGTPAADGTRRARPGRRRDRNRS